MKKRQTFNANRSLRRRSIANRSPVTLRRQPSCLSLSSRTNAGGAEGKDGGTTVIYSYVSRAQRFSFWFECWTIFKLNLKSYVVCNLKRGRFVRPLFRRTLQPASIRLVSWAATAPQHTALCRRELERRGSCSGLDLQIHCTFHLSSFKTVDGNGGYYTSLLVPCPGQG